MSGYSYRRLGTFDSESAVDLWARENRVDVRDVKTRKKSDGSIEAEVREDAYDASESDVFGGYSRNTGFL